MSDNSVHMEKQKRKRKAWKESSEEALLELWKECIAELRLNRKNGHVYAEMASELCKMGHIHDRRDVQVKIQNFTRRYRQETEAMGQSKSPSNWVLYNRVHQIIGDCKANEFGELKRETIDESSTASVLLTASEESLPEPPAQVFVSVTEEKQKNNYQADCLRIFEDTSQKIADYLKKSAEADLQFLEIEKEKSETFKKIAKDSEELKDALIAYLNKH